METCIDVSALAKLDLGSQLGALTAAPQPGPRNDEPEAPLPDVKGKPGKTSAISRSDPMNAKKCHFIFDALLRPHRRERFVDLTKQKTTAKSRQSFRRDSS